MLIGHQWAKSTSGQFTRLHVKLRTRQSDALPGNGAIHAAILAINSIHVHVYIRSRNLRDFQSLIRLPTAQS